MQHIVGGFLRSIDPVSYCTVLALLALVYAAWRSAVGRRIGVSDRVYRSLLLAAGVAGSLGSLVAFGLALQYVDVPGFIGHIDPQIAAVGWRSCLGDPAHPNMYTGPQTALPYGPIDYHIQCLAFKLWGPSITVSKATGIAAFGLTLIIIFSLVFCHWPRLRQSSSAILFVGWSGVVLPVITSDTALNAHFWNRPEPFIMALAAVGAFASLMRHQAARAVILGVLAGLAIALKPSAVLVFLPLLALDFPWHSVREGLTAFAIFLVFCTASVALAFVGDDVEGYILRTIIDVQADTVPPLVLHTAALAVVISIPAVAGLWGRDKIETRFTASLLLYLLCLAVGIYAGSREGAGPHHLTHYFPVAIALALAGARPGAAEAGRPHGREVSTAIAGLTLLTLPLAGLYGIRLLDAYEKSERLRPHLEEIQQIAARLENRQVHYGANTDRETYRLTWLRPEVVFRAGGSYLVDPAAVMGLAKLVPPAEAILHRIADCRGAVWLLPAQGKPLSLVSFGAASNDEVVYNRRYAEVLHEYYEHTETIGAYALWTCKADGRARNNASEDRKTPQEPGTVFDRGDHPCLPTWRCQSAARSPRRGCRACGTGEAGAKRPRRCRARRYAQYAGMPSTLTPGRVTAPPKCLIIGGDPPGGPRTRALDP